MEIVTSKVSVYEIELDLGQWNQIDTNQVPGFYDSLSKVVESIKTHKCTTGQMGGFLVELRKGTNFAHVIEHVILELIHLADPEKQVYTGWTRKKGGHTYIIHYSAPDFLTGRLAAILSVDLVKRLIKGEQVKLQRFLETLRNPINYFTQDDILSEDLSDMIEPISVIQEVEGLAKGERIPTYELSLSESQVDKIKTIS